MLKDEELIEDSDMVERWLAVRYLRVSIDMAIKAANKVSHGMNDEARGDLMQLVGYLSVVVKDLEGENK